MGGLMIKAITISCAAISLLAAAGTAAAQTGDTIKIGMAVSSTGNFALAAQSGERGAKIWVDDVNRRGGIELGGKKYKIELIERETTAATRRWSRGSMRASSTTTRWTCSSAPSVRP
jgi:hypothetical protein